MIDSFPASCLALNCDGSQDVADVNRVIAIAYLSGNMGVAFDLDGDMIHDACDPDVDGASNVCEEGKGTDPFSNKSAPKKPSDCDPYAGD